ncbi:MAG TPA: S8 family serine peptidase [Terriglobales bacterium]|nr:S8 family serine peptidase [Terriglobales bacterium]
MSAARIVHVKYSYRTFCSATIFLVVLISAPLHSQDTQTTDLQLHKFHPKDASEQAAAPTSQHAAAPSGAGAIAVQQMQALQAEKAVRTPAQQKIDSNILFTIRMLAGQPAAPGIPYLDTGIELDGNDNVVVDMVAQVTDSLLNQLAGAGATILNTNRELRSIRAIIPPSQMEGLAASPDVIYISRKQGSMTQGAGLLRKVSPWLRWTLVPGFEKRAVNLGRQLAMLTSLTPFTPVTWQGSVGTEGDVSHEALAARGAFGVNGAGLKIGVLSDGVTNHALSQATGDLPPDCGTPPCLAVLSGQAGSGDEGTAMLEIIHDMAPGASLYFATAENGITSFAQNIRDLRAAGCQIIVDDVFYFVESPFQNGQTFSVVSTSNGGVVTQAVNDVVADGALYFSSAGNEGNLDSATSGTYEGDFVPQTATLPLPPGYVHNFGGDMGYDTITAPGLEVVGLWWADPLGGSSNDYDLYVLNSTGTIVLAASTNIQNGSQDPVELIGSAYVAANNRIVVFQNPGAADRFFHLGLIRGKLAVASAGETHGHSAASGAYTVGATPAADAFTTGYPSGPYPDFFSAGNRFEPFSSDGLRRIFFNGDSGAITPGNFSSTGGLVLNKPDITAADGVSVTGVGGFGSPFYGTSASAPAAASVAALLLAAQPTLTPGEVRTALNSTAVDIMASGYDRDSGYGIVMALRSIQSLGVEGNANPELGAITVAENPGNGNGIIEAGEGAKLNIQLKNTGGVKAMNAVTATLTSSTEGVVITQPGTSAYADIAAGASGGNNLSPFFFTLASEYACGKTADFTLTVNFTGGSRAVNFTVPTGLLFITNSLGTKPAESLGITTATGTQSGRINRNGVVSSCGGSAKSFPGAISGSHIFDSYSFTACRSFCLEPELDSGASGVNLLESAYTPSYDSSNTGTNYAGDAGLSTNQQSFGINATAGTPYTLVISDVAGNSTPNTYTLKIPACALSCNNNQLPEAVAHDTTVIAANVGGTADANIENGSYDPEGDSLTISQTPPGPYPVGVNTVILTVADAHGAADQASASITVLNPGFTLARTDSSVTTVAGSATQHITFTPAPGIAAPLNLTCRDLPDEASCSFAPATLPAGSGATTVTLAITTTAPAVAFVSVRNFFAASLPFSGLGFLGIALMAGPSRRKKATVIAASVLATVALALFLGCGDRTATTFLGMPQRTYTVTVAGTSGNLTRTTTFNLTVN